MTGGPNAALIRRGYEALARRDIEVWLAGFHPDAELNEFADHPDQGSFHGHDGLRKWLEEGMDSLTVDSRFEVEELVERGDRVLAIARFKGRELRGGIEFNARVFHVFEMRDGLVARVSGYHGEAEARRAAGM